jgi:hypothetical protein
MVKAYIPQYLMMAGMSRFTALPAILCQTIPMSLAMFLSTIDKTKRLCGLVSIQKERKVIMKAHFLQFLVMGGT